MRMYVRTHITPFGRIRTRRMYVIRLRLGIIAEQSELPVGFFLVA